MEKPETLEHPPPDSLSTEAKEWWTKIVAEFEIYDAAGFLLLRTSLEALDRMRECQAQIKRDGEQVKDRFSQWKPHPLLAAERDARSQMLLALKQLDLDLEPVKPRPGRPAGTFYKQKRANANN